MRNTICNWFKYTGKRVGVYCCQIASFDQSAPHVRANIDQSEKPRPRVYLGTHLKNNASRIPVLSKSLPMLLFFSRWASFERNRPQVPCHEGCKSPDRDDIYTLVTPSLVPRCFMIDTYIGTDDPLRDLGGPISLVPPKRSHVTNITRRHIVKGAE